MLIALLALLALSDSPLAEEVVQLDPHSRSQYEVFAHKIGYDSPEKPLATDFYLSGWYLLSGKADSLNLPADFGHKCRHSPSCYSCYWCC